jgi:hypothetical protein
MYNHLANIRSASRAKVVSNRTLKLMPHPQDELRGLAITGPNNGNVVTPTNWSFGQLATLAKAPAGYLRTLPAPMAADCLNYGLHVARDIDEVGVLVTKQDDQLSLRAATGPNYGRIWNSDIVATLMRQFGDGVTGDWSVPGIFGQKVMVTKDNTTLYASDRDIFVFLADEKNRIEIPNRRNGQPGSLARGFFVWNSEVGSAVLGIGFFLFDYVCCNRIVWGAEQYIEKRLRHTSGAPDRWLEQAVPMLDHYSQATSVPVMRQISAAQDARFDNEEKVRDFLTNRFTKSMAKTVMDRHIDEEDRAIETVWDCVIGLTAVARDIPHQDTRVELERKAGKLLGA